MADNKQYITQIQDRGNVMISEDVIAAIVEHALLEVEGVASLSTKVGSDLVELIGKNWGKGMKIQIADDNSLTISCNVIVKYNFSVVDVASSVQNTLANAVESMTGVKVRSVNVNVCGIVRQ